MGYKQIIAIIRPECLPGVQRGLNCYDGLGMTVTTVQGCGVQRGIRFQTRGGSYQVELLDKIQIMLVVDETQVECVVQSIIENARTNRGPGDGKIFILPCEDVIRIRTGEHSLLATPSEAENFFQN